MSELRSNEPRGTTESTHITRSSHKYNNNA